MKYKHIHTYMHIPTHIYIESKFIGCISLRNCFLRLKVSKTTFEGSHSCFVFYGLTSDRFVTMVVITHTEEICLQAGIPKVLMIFKETKHFGDYFQCV